MKKLIILVSVLIAFASIGVAGTVTISNIPVSPGGTFLTQSANDNCAFNPHDPALCTGAGFFSPSVIDLLAFGINNGDPLSITISGVVCYMMASCSISGPPVIGAIFSSTPIFLDAAQPNRVPNGVSSGLPSLPTSMYFNLAGTVAGANQNNTNPNDFVLAFGSTTNVNAAGRYLFLGILDSFYADNSGTAFVNITATTQGAVPEPGTYVLMLAGMGLIAVRKLRA